MRVTLGRRPWQPALLDRPPIGIADRIFTRVSASDDLGRGQSTFLVEISKARRRRGSMVRAIEAFPPHPSDPPADPRRTRCPVHVS
jgi:hypothetical protein